MHDSDIESGDEDEIFRNFDEEAHQIVQVETLPKKSANRYLLVYDTFQKWKDDHKNFLSSSEESNLIVYFRELIQVKKLKPSTLWSVWSMLKKTINTKENVDIKKFQNLKSMVKKNAKGYKPKKALIFTWDNIVNFIESASDYHYLALKVILIFGICGAMRCEEIVNIATSDVEDIGHQRYLVSIDESKNDEPRQFLIGSPFYSIVNSYVSRRPDDYDLDRFFITYHKGNCVRQPIGRNKIGESGKTIAEFLQLKDAQKFTGHCLRATGTTLLAESGANENMIMQLGGWKSVQVAHSYIRKTVRSRQQIFNGITQQNFSQQCLVLPLMQENLDPINPLPGPSSSTSFELPRRQPVTSTSGSFVPFRLQPGTSNLQCTRLSRLSAGSSAEQLCESSVGQISGCLPESSSRQDLGSSELPLNSLSQQDSRCSETHTSIQQVPVNNVDSSSNKENLSSNCSDPFLEVLDEYSSDLSDEFVINEDHIKQLEISHLEETAVTSFTGTINKQSSVSREQPVDNSVKKSAVASASFKNAKNQKLVLSTKKKIPAEHFLLKEPVELEYNNSKLDDKNKKRKLSEDDARPSTSEVQSEVLEENNNNYVSDPKNTSGNKYINCVFHGNIVNNFYQCHDSNNK